MDDIFPTELKARLEQIGSADIVVGIPSYNNARTIGQVVRAVSVGLAKHFPGQRSVIVNSDGGSRDNTREIVLNSESGAEDLIRIAKNRGGNGDEPENSIFNPKNPSYILKDGCAGR